MVHDCQYEDSVTAVLFLVPFHGSGIRVHDSCVGVRVLFFLKVSVGEICAGVSGGDPEPSLVTGVIRFGLVNLGEIEPGVFVGLVNLGGGPLRPGRSSWGSSAWSPWSITGSFGAGSPGSQAPFSYLGGSYLGAQDRARRGSGPSVGLRRSASAWGLSSAWAGCSGSQGLPAPDPGGSGARITGVGFPMTTCFSSPLSHASGVSGVSGLPAQGLGPFSRLGFFGVK